MKSRHIMRCVPMGQLGPITLNRSIPEKEETVLKVEQRPTILGVFIRQFKVKFSRIIPEEEVTVLEMEQRYTTRGVFMTQFKSTTLVNSMVAGRSASITREGLINGRSACLRDYQQR